VRGLGLVYALGRGGPYLCVLVQTGTDMSDKVDVCIGPMGHTRVDALRDTIRQMCVNWGVVLFHSGSGCAVLVSVCVLVVYGISYTLGLGRYGAVCMCGLLGVDVCVGDCWESEGCATCGLLGVDVCVCDCLESEGCKWCGGR
jgi:hypothetical protein